MTTQINKHTTHNSWIVWYHNPADTDWSTKSYKDIIEISSIEDYCVLKNSWDLCLPKVSEGMFFLMRKINNETCIYPQWEDKNNINGGCWSFKIPKNKCQDVWFDLIKYILGECLIHKDIDYSIVNGISISPKKNFSIIKIWLKYNTTINIHSLLTNEIEFLNYKESMYSKHASNIKKDQIKTNKKNSSKYKKNYHKKHKYKDSFFNKKEKYSDFNSNIQKDIFRS
tara:strand:+ start:1176 stop:1853 length:678 start_codon:yes stop_codon:yes gene_type:complete